eukprot:2765901-Amphidinium_carterae.1
MLEITQRRPPSQNCHKWFAHPRPLTVAIFCYAMLKHVASQTLGGGSPAQRRDYRTVLLKMSSFEHFDVDSQHCFGT